MVGYIHQSECILTRSGSRGYLWSCVMNGFEKARSVMIKALRMSDERGTIKLLRHALPLLIKNARFLKFPEVFLILDYVL